MDLIERLRARAKQYGGDWLLNEAADALEAAREDVERYRWMRENEPDREDVFLPYCYDELDAAIDHARGKGE